MYKKILIPIDISSPERIFQANKMIQAARKLANDDAVFYLLNVVEAIPAYVAAELPTDIMEKSRENAKAVLQSVANNAGLKARIEIGSGRPQSVILQAAQEGAVDLVVIGSHHPELKDYLLGSTAARVVRHADCSVHVVR